MGHFRNVLFISSLALLSCTDDAENFNHLICVISDKLYVFRPSDNEITTILDLGTQPHMSARSGNELFIHSYPYQRRPLSLNVVDLNNMSVKRSKQYGLPFGEVSGFSVADKIFTYDYGTKGPFIATLNRETLEPGDTTLTSNLPYNGQDLLVVGNKVFLNFASLIKVLDATTFEEIKTFDVSNPVFPSGYSKFILDKDNKILIYDGALRRLSPEDLTMKALRKQEASIYWPIKRPAYNPGDGVVYILLEKIESGEITYLPRKFDLNTLKEEDFVTDPAVLSFDVDFISYNSGNHLIIIGGRNSAGGILKTFNTAGVFQKEYVIPSGAGASAAY